MDPSIQVILIFAAAATLTLFAAWAVSKFGPR